MLSIGLISFHNLDEQTADRKKRFLQDRQNELLTLSEEQTVANYLHNLSYGLTEEATLNIREIERYFKRFADRYNSTDLIYAGIYLIDQKGREIAKVREGRTGGEYQSVSDKTFFQNAIRLPFRAIYVSPIEQHMITATSLYLNEDGNSELSASELRGVIAIDFLYPINQFRRERQVMAAASIGITILAIIVTAIAVSLLLRRVTRPLHRLVDATKAISSGDLSTKIPVQSDDEVGLLASSFNQMARDLKANIGDKDRYADELAKLNIELEEKVQARTSELEETNRDLEVANQKIKEADQLKSEFLANMSHELRTPMNSIIGFTRLVRKKSAGILPKRQRENLDRVEISANRLLALINDILDLSKIEAGKLRVNMMPLNLGPLFDTCLATVEPMAKKGKVRIVKDVVPEDMPEVLSDQDKLTQILINLLSNAIKFTEEGEVRLSATVENNSFKIAVSDTGIGIPPEALEYIFDEFRQVDGSTTRAHGGTGLGLSITKKLAHLLGGGIEVRSVQGKGSTFTVTLPTHKRERVASQSPVRTDETAPAPVTMPKKKVLLTIDDDPNVLILLKQNLEDEGYYVVGALSADEGIRKAKEIHPFAITLDILMPHKDGWGVLNELKADPATRDIPIIVLSIIENKQLGYSLGAFDYLLKPIDKDAIMGALQRIIVHSAKQALVVDDDRDTIGLLTQILQDEGHTVTAAFNGTDALLALEAVPMDIILLDLLMPEMDGFEVIQRVKGNPMWKDIPIIVLTAKDLTNMEWGALQQRVNRIIQKSGLAGESLIGEVRALLREHGVATKESRIHEESVGG
jgi:signal transduction histidine kinase/CheY-like chemotaxis protein